jgi:hypothetical protein
MVRSKELASFVLFPNMSLSSGSSARFEHLKKCFLPILLNEYKHEFGYTVNSKDELERIEYAITLDQCVVAQAVKAKEMR